MIRRPPRSTRTDTLFPYTTRFRSILGPFDEDPGYCQECRDLVAMLGLGETVKFMGQVKLDDWLGRIDAIVLTSISEAQPLVILEAGAAGVPTVATDVGACREMILGPPDESRSEERRVGKECLSTCRSRWSQDHEQKNTKKK